MGVDDDRGARPEVAEVGAQRGGFIATSTSGASPGVRMSWSAKWTWNDETPGRVPCGARISAGKLGSVDRSLPNAADSWVNRSPVSCMPSPESPAKRMMTRSSCLTCLVATCRCASLVVPVPRRLPDTMRHAPVVRPCHRPPRIVRAHRVPAHRLGPCGTDTAHTFEQCRCVRLLMSSSLHELQMFSGTPEGARKGRTMRNELQGRAVAARFGALALERVLDRERRRQRTAARPSASNALLRDGGRQQARLRGLEATDAARASSSRRRTAPPATRAAPSWPVQTPTSCTSRSRPT